ncbi:CXXX repeat peptide modification system protein [Clostridium sp. HBUAS56017]|uniref:CXXX repeat peptide modification system protein n=1 Tax=Clostridium cibarium TaxID=2762247 RepID=A0ABR8PSB0_9CLOT|nr:CXXX repeat peptide modification system protein [Clostridium sp. HBUAS56017]MBD7911032.1 CXXX repeat peptide modification system protein [Clostridium cibarium]
MFKEKLGNLKLNEREEILMLLERKWALEELMDALDSQPYSDEEKKDLHIRIVADLEKNQVAYKKWMSDITEKYHWKIGDEARCKIDFNTSEIFIVQQSE